MNKKIKEIMEMRRVICRVCGVADDCKLDQVMPCVACKDLAEALYNAGYRKLEPNIEFKITAGEISNIIERARKQAIKEFSEKLRSTLIINNEENTEIFDYDFTLETIKELAKKYGIDIDKEEQK